MKIGEISINPPLILAPMAGYTDSVFRRICREYGAGMTVTELISSCALVYKNKKTFEMLRWSEEERPIAVQIFGGDPEMMAEASKIVAEYHPDFIDINMGCSVPKVIRTGSGAVLCKDASSLYSMVRSVTSAVSIPVTVKMRRSWDSCENPGPEELAQAAEEGGAAAITLHPRTAVQGFQGIADWDAIQRVKNAVSIPVIGSGDVKTPQDAVRMQEETGCDGVMIGRAALGNPWIFQRIAHFLETGELLPLPSDCERIQMAIRHARELVSFHQDEHALHGFRSHIGWYLKKIPNISQARIGAVRAVSLKEFEDALNSYLEDDYEKGC